MPTFKVTLPVAGHAYLEIEADTAKEAVDLAFERVTLQDVEEWEALKRFVKGNVCCCPSPWEVYVEDESGDEIDADDEGAE